MCGCRNHWDGAATCTCNCPEHAGRRKPKRRSDRHQDACSLVCQAAYEGGGNCSTYVGRHRAAVQG